MDLRLAVHQIQNVDGVHRMGCVTFGPLHHLVDKVICKLHRVLEYVLLFQIVDLVQLKATIPIHLTKQGIQQEKRLKGQVITMKSFRKMSLIFSDYVNVRGAHHKKNVSHCMSLLIDVSQLLVGIGKVF